MWLYTKLDADESPELLDEGLSGPFSLSVLRQRDDMGGQPILLLRSSWRGCKTVALLSDRGPPPTVCEDAMRPGVEADLLVLLPIPPGTDQVRARRKAPAQGDLARLDDLLEDVLRSAAVRHQKTELQLIPLSDMPSRVLDMWNEGPVLLKDMDECDGLAPFALPPGVPKVESIMSWASNRGLDCALNFSRYKPFYTNQITESHTMYHQEMLERFGVRFGEKGGYSMQNVHQIFPPLFVPTPLAHLRIDADFIGRMDTGVVPYEGGSYDSDYLQKMRIGFIHMPLPQANEGSETGRNKEEVEQCCVRAMCVLSCTQQQPFYLDITDGESHSILYRTHNTRVTLHANCTPVEAYYLLSGLLKGDITYGGATPDFGQLKCQANPSATPTDNTEAPALADSSVVSDTVNADSANPYVDGAPNHMAVKPGAVPYTCDASDTEYPGSSIDEEECRTTLAMAQAKVVVEHLKVGLEERTDPRQCDDEESDNDHSGAAVSKLSSDSPWSTNSDAGWQII